MQAVMRIRSAEVIVTSPGRNFVTLKVTTDEGLTGLGDATLNGRELAVAAYLRDHVAPLLIGRDAHRIEDTWQFLYRGGYWRRGPVTMAAIGAVDAALWALKGAAGAQEPAAGGARPAEETWDTGRYLRHIPGVLERVRRHVGPDVLLLHDVHHRIPPV